MFGKLLANALGSILKSSGIETNVNSRSFNIKKTLGIIGISLLFASLAFLLARVGILSKRLVDIQDNYKCVKIVKKTPKGKKP